MAKPRAQSALDPVKVLVEVDDLEFLLNGILVRDGRVSTEDLARFATLDLTMRDQIARARRSDGYHRRPEVPQGLDG